MLTLKYRQKKKTIERLVFIFVIVFDVIRFRPRNAMSKVFIYATIITAITVMVITKFMYDYIYFGNDARNELLGVILGLLFQ